MIALAREFGRGGGPGGRPAFAVAPPGAGTSPAGSALIAVLWCVVVLAVVAVGMLYSTHIELRVAKNFGDSRQAYYLALAGVETAKAMIYRESMERKRLRRTIRSSLHDNPQIFRDVRLGRGMFRVLRGAGPDESLERVVFGIRGEDGRLNVNTASLDELRRLPDMTPAAAAAIVDWRDPDDKLTPEGAEQEYYSNLGEPIRMRNGALETLRELLRVRGVDEDLLLGEDADFDGILDARENDGELSYPMDNRNGALDAGWSEWLTVHSSVPDVNAAGETRVNIKTADEDELFGIDGISPELAQAIVAYREKNSLDSVGHLLDVTPVREETNAPQVVTGNPEVRQVATPDGRAAPEVELAPSGVQGASPAGAGQPSGEKLISEDLLKRIADDVTALGSPYLAGAININTAPADVLACLSDVDYDLAQEIVAHRRKIQFFSNIAEILDVSGMTQEIFKKIANRLSVRSATFRILAEGVVLSTLARKRIEVVVRLESYGYETLQSRDL